MHETAHRRILVGIIALPVIVVSYALARYGPLLLDDGYYYLNVARHLAQGDGFTFDGLHRTNGFHLLWQLLLVPLFWIAPDRTWVAYAASIVQAGLFVGSGIALYHTARRLVQRPAYALLAPALWLFNLWVWNKGALSGMETGLLLLCYGMALLALTRLMTGEGSVTALAIWLLLATAARLDTLALTLSAGVVLVVAGRPRQALAAAAPAFVYTALYAAWSTAHFGYPVPVSGFVKSAAGRTNLAALLQQGDLELFAHAWRSIGGMFTLRYALPWPAAAMGMAVVAAPGLWLWRTATQQEHDPLRARALRVVAAAHALYMLILIAYYSAMYDSLVGIYPYYWLPSLYGVTLLAAVAVAALPWARVRRSVAGLLVAGVCAVSIVYAADLLNTYHFVVAPANRPETHVAQYMNRELPPDAIVGSWDAGYLAYYTDRPVVNLDGRVNSFEFVHYAESGRMDEYLDVVGIDYIANVSGRASRITWLEEKLGWEKIFEAEAPPVLRSSRFHFLYSTVGQPQVYRRSVYIYQRPAE